MGLDLEGQVFWKLHKKDLDHHVCHLSSMKATLRRDQWMVKSSNLHSFFFLLLWPLASFYHHGYTQESGQIKPILWWRRPPFLEDEPFFVSWSHSIEKKKKKELLRGRGRGSREERKVESLNMGPRGWVVGKRSE